MLKGKTGVIGFIFMVAISAFLPEYVTILSSALLKNNAGNFAFLIAVSSLVVLMFAFGGPYRFENSPVVMYFLELFTGAYVGVLLVCTLYGGLGLR